jgi:hypothetical protein
VLGQNPVTDLKMFIATNLKLVTSDKGKAKKQILKKYWNNNPKKNSSRP